MAKPNWTTFHCRPWEQLKLFGVFLAGYMAMHLEVLSCSKAHRLKSIKHLPPPMATSAANTWLAAIAPRMKRIFFARLLNTKNTTAIDIGVVMKTAL